VSEIDTTPQEREGDPNAGHSRPKELDQTAQREKNTAALSSVIAAIVLTSFKLIVGLATGSLGILAEAAHSALDLAAALVTFFAVRVAGRPADEEHRYGHGKVENLSALFETALLLVTCIWIIYEAVQRLFFNPVEVDASVWAFVVMFVSIAVDYSRSRVLFRAARRHNSQALEADALHFSTDIWSSSVVILGLIGVRLAAAFPRLTVLKQADAVAAVGVAFIVIYISLQLGKRTIMALLDTAPSGVVAKITAAVDAVPGVSQTHHVRVRPSGPFYFVDVHVLMQADLPLGQAHDLTEQVTDAIHNILPGADVTVHPEPMETGTQDE